jgi:L-2-hydroxyglutarate oxidase
VYPIPDPSLPFLGVHLTRMVDGSITVGPNAVQGWKREGYGRFNFSPRDTLETLSFPGFWKMSLKYLGTGVREYRDSLWKRGYLERVRKYCPEVNLEDLLPYPAGVRAQAMLPDGTLVHDFLLERTPRSLHVCNAPSPAATSAIPIAHHLCDVLFDQPSPS